MAKSDYTRREFLAVSAAVVATGLVGASCGGGGGDSQPTSPETQPETVFRLSLRGRRASKASLKHNANKLFATAQAADQNRSHPGDRSRVVSFKVNKETFNRLFDDGKRSVVDLRSI
ncbi:MAG: hypothetical protein HY788_02530 [Deltaproteobacteria bacterium]|nr:hypothetical protein [Deltaproteobacteria bacterium]